MAGAQDVVQLPFKITEFDESMLLALDRNFKEIEHQLSLLQGYIKEITGGKVSAITDSAETWDRASFINEDGTIDTERLNGLITELQLAADAVTEAKIAAGAVTNGKIATAAVAELQLAANAVTEAKIAVAAVTGGKIAANAVTADKIQANAVTSDKIYAGAVTSDKITAGAVTALKIAAGAVDVGKIQAGAVISEKIAADAVTSDKINVNQLSAISANMGNITAGTLTTGSAKIISSDGHVEVNGTGVKVTHSDGTYSQLTASGLVRQGSSNWNYNYLVHVGESTTYDARFYQYYFSMPVWVPSPNGLEVGSVVFGYGYYGNSPGNAPDGTGPGDYYNQIPTSIVPDVEIALPADFQGKNFKVFLYLKEVPALTEHNAYADITVPCGPPSTYLAVQSINYAAAYFTVRGYCYQKQESYRPWHGQATRGDVYTFNVPYIGNFTSYNEWHISYVLQGIDFGYIAIY